MGWDWNLDEEGICDLVSEWDTDIPGVQTLWPMDSSSRTRGTCMRGRGRVIDHIVAWPGDGCPPHSLRIGYSWDISDHFPIFSYIYIYYIYSYCAVRFGDKHAYDQHSML